MNRLGAMKHFQWYKAAVLYSDRNTIIGRSYYDGYPFTVFQDEQGVTALEGAVFNKSEKKVEQEFNRITRSKLPLDQLLNDMKDFILSTEGEFVITRYDKQTRKCTIVNDALGRLPVYYSVPQQSSSTVIVSREAKFIIPFLGRPDFDMNAVAEFLLFGYPLGERTLWKGIKRLPPAAVLIIDAEENSFFVKEVFSWNLEPAHEDHHTLDNLQGRARLLTDLFLSSLKDAAKKFSKDHTLIVSLSGGLDSRAALAGLLEIGVKPVTCSFPSPENDLAKRVARTLNVEHRVVSSPFDIPNEEYVSLTDGLLSLNLRSLVSYLYGIRKEIVETAILYTGDGGDKTLSPLGFKFGISDVRELISYIIETDRIFDLDEISSILSMDKDSFRTHLENHITTYPEKTLEGKFVHFKVFERGFKWLFVGEDRNRLFLWSATPFYSLQFFRASMAESQRAKEHYVLYKNFLSCLNPILIRIRYFDRFLPLSIPDWLLRLYLTVFELLKMRFYKQGTMNPLERFFGGRPQEMSLDTKKSMLHILGKKDVFDFLNSSRVAEIIKSEKNQIKLNILGTFILHLNLVRSLDHPKVLV